MRISDVYGLLNCYTRLVCDLVDNTNCGNNRDHDVDDVGGVCFRVSVYHVVSSDVILVWSGFPGGLMGVRPR